MSNTIATQLRDPAIPDEMEVEHFANAKSLKRGSAIELFLRITGIAAAWLSPLTVVGSFIALAIIDVPTDVGFIILISSLAGIPLGFLVGAGLLNLADDMPERKIEKWLHVQGHKFTSDDITKLTNQGEVVLRDNPTGLKFKIKRELLASGAIRISYNVVKKPKPKAIPVEGKRTLLQSFTSSNQELVDSIRGKGEQLLALPISVEDQHAVERVLSDLDELNKLGSTAQGVEPTKLQMRTLKTLNKEMKALAANVNSGMVKQLKIHASYVEERNRVRNELSLDMKTRKVTS